MKKQWLITLVLALGMGIVQAQTPGPVPMQSGQGGDKSAQTPQSPNPTGGAAAASDATGTAASTNNAPQTFKGCLRQAAGSWTLASDDGKSMTVSGADDKLVPHNGQEVNISGTQASDGTLSVASIDKVSDS